MRRAYIELHTAVFLFGFTAILGRLISVSALSLVWWRVLITGVSLVLIVSVWRGMRGVPRKHIFHFMGIGCIVAVHWLTFFGAINLSNASVALVALATTSFFTATVEPFVMGQRVRVSELLTGLVIVPAMALTARGVDPSMHAGIWLGLASAVLAALFASLNKRLIMKADPLQITTIEISSAWLFLTLGLLGVMAMPGIPAKLGFDTTLQMPARMDWLYLLVLALVCTTFAYVLAMRALRHLSAFASNLTINLEPVYGIALAWLLLKEHRELGWEFYLGVCIIAGVVVLYPVYKHRAEGIGHRA